MEEFLIKALQLILSLSILVVVHEFGHFIFARLFKIRVEKFYLFFDPWFSIFKFKPKNSDTEYGIGWLPLGGYVKISGMIDESMDTDQMSQEPKPWEFRTKPAWQRLLVMAAGALFNFILAWFIYSMMLFAWGDSYISTKNLEYGMKYSAEVKKVGFQDGDIIKSIDGKDFNLRSGVLAVNDMMQFLDGEKVVVLRDGKEVTISLPEDFADKIIADKGGDPMFQMILPSIVDSVLEGSVAQKHGILKGDSITMVNNVSIESFSQFQKEIIKNADSVAINLQLYRTGDLITIENIQVSKKELLGVSISYGDAVKTDSYSFLASFPAGAKLGYETLKAYVSQMRFLFSKDGLSNLGGFGSIGGMFSPVWDWHYFWIMTAFLSIVLGFMNLIPIPALDGGHIMFLLYEVIARRKPSEKFMEHAQVIGMLLILALIIIANGNDLIRAFSN